MNGHELNNLPLQEFFVNMSTSMSGQIQSAVRKQPGHRTVEGLLILITVRVLPQQGFLSSPSLPRYQQTVRERPAEGFLQPPSNAPSCPFDLIKLLLNQRSKLGFFFFL